MNTTKDIPDGFEVVRLAPLCWKWRITSGATEGRISGRTFFTRRGAIKSAWICSYMHIPLDTLTCYKCPQRGHCIFVDDPYNTDGDCLADK